MTNERNNQERIIGLLIERGAGAFFTANIVYEFGESVSKYTLEDMVVGRRRFMTNWKGEPLVLSALRILKFTWLGPNSARIEFFDGISQKLDIHDVPTRSLELLQQSMTSSVPDVSAHELENTKF